MQQPLARGPAARLRTTQCKGPQTFPLWHRFHLVSPGIKSATHAPEHPQWAQLTRHSRAGSTAGEGLLFPSGKCSLAGHLYQSLPGLLQRCRDAWNLFGAQRGQWQSGALTPCQNTPGLDDLGGFALLPPIFLGNTQLRHTHFVNPVFLGCCT